ncbi:MAG: NUDIX hydrolase [Gammaproteobacteria bacterium HGW-Gammaproteobacteria-8]|nr:MAG: NUDIX hydrolase [Gammaproteobacteria bacterium HGW-Gammaproteobacteria-8]
MLLPLLAAYRERHPEQDDLVERFLTLLSEHPDCYSRHCWAGHITGSAWIVDPSGERVLLTHHRKLDRWLQPGGHSDDDPDTLGVALREAEEETGLVVAPVESSIFDIDIHPIPARGAEPEHFHFDVRFLLRAQTLDYVVSDESHDLAWVPLARLGEWSTEPSLLRMADKWHRVRAQRQAGQCRNIADA